MLPAIYLDNQFRFWAEIYDVIAKNQLPEKLITTELPPSYPGPESNLGIGHAESELSRMLL